jgi:flavin-binding protein dodecin
LHVRIESSPSISDNILGDFLIPFNPLDHHDVLSNRQDAQALHFIDSTDSLFRKGGTVMSVYKFVELVGTSPKSWEDAAQNVVMTAGKSLEELRIAEVVKQDLVVTKGTTIFRIRLNVSFKYLREDEEATVGWAVS